MPEEIVDDREFGGDDGRRQPRQERRGREDDECERLDGKAHPADGDEAGEVDAHGSSYMRAGENGPPIGSPVP